MKICSIVDSQNPHTIRWANYFAEAGHEVHLISWLPCDGFNKNVHFHALPCLMPNAWSITKYPSHLVWPITVKQIIKEIQPDVVDGQGVTIRGYLAAFSGFHPVVLIGWGSDILIHPKNILWRTLTKMALKKADRVIGSSQLLKREFIKLGVDPTKTRVVVLGVDITLFSPSRRDEQLRKRLGLGTDPTVISIRNLRPIYDVETLIRAVPLVLKELPNVKFVIGGDGEDRQKLETFALSLQVKSNIIFTGWISPEEMPKYLASADAYVSTALSDTLQVSLLEAQASGLASVVTDLPAMRDQIKDGENGFLIPTRNHKMLAEKIIVLIKNGALRKRFGELGRKYVMEKAEHKTEMNKAIEIYQELVTRSRIKQ